MTAYCLPRPDELGPFWRKP